MAINIILITIYILLSQNIYGLSPVSSFAESRSLWSLEDPQIDDVSIEHHQGMWVISLKNVQDRGFWKFWWITATESVELENKKTVFLRDIFQMSDTSVSIPIFVLQSMGFSINNLREKLKMFFEELKIFKQYDEARKGLILKQKHDESLKILPYRKAYEKEICLSKKQELYQLLSRMENNLYVQVVEKEGRFVLYVGVSDDILKTLWDKLSTGDKAVATQLNLNQKFELMQREDLRFFYSIPCTSEGSNKPGDVMDLVRGYLEKWMSEMSKKIPDAQDARPLLVHVVQDGQRLLSFHVGQDQQEQVLEFFHKMVSVEKREALSLAYNDLEVLHDNKENPDADFCYEVTIPLVIHDDVLSSISGTLLSAS